MRLLWFSVLLAVLLAIPFLLFGDQFERSFTGDAALRSLRECGSWAWAAIIALLVADLVLPLPGTALMSAGGYIYGAFLGGLLGALGSFLSGLMAYALCRKFGRGVALRLAGAADLARGEALFEQRGPWLVALSRALPLLPEVVACLAGITRMPLRRFTLALACGCVPIGFTYAAIGAAGQDRPGLALAFSVGMPALLWLVVRRSLALDEEATGRFPPGGPGS
jgi:uncharacterized membrane protein YdjX (TVP38/TMEM64 family)